MNKILTLILCTFFVTNIQAQSPIMLCDSLGNTCTPFYNLDSAYTAAVDGSYIYIPGGVFTVGATINKRVHMIGSGYNLDSALITNTTQISGGLALGNNAGGSSFEGLYLTGAITGPTATFINSVSFKYLSCASISMKLSNSLIRSCILRTGSSGGNTFYGGINNEISNSYIVDISQLSNSVIQHCIGIYYATSCVLNLFKNNICDRYPAGTGTGNIGSGNSLVYNVYTSNCTQYCISSIYTANNVLMTEAAVFAAGSFTTSNMHLLAGSAALTAGENGTEVGVYGGLFPFKEGGVPSNPHIFQKAISASTNVNGQLPVQIKVRAEDY